MHPFGLSSDHKSKAETIRKIFLHFLPKNNFLSLHNHSWGPSENNFLKIIDEGKRHFERYYKGILKLFKEIQNSKGHHKGTLI